MSDSPTEEEKEKGILRAALRSEPTYFSEIYISVFNIVTVVQVSRI